MTTPYWRLSSFYFFYFAALGSFLPYWSLYLEHLHFNAMEIGELSALMVATKVVAPNLWGWIADHTGKRLRVIRVVSFLAAVIFSGFFQHNSYLWIAAITIGFSFFWNAALSQFEAVTLFHLRKEPQRYSQVRLWGSIGFIVSVLTIGRFINSHSIDYLPEWIIAFLTMIWLVSLMMPEVDAIPQRDVGGLFQIIKQPEIIAFFAVYSLLQVSHGPYYVFYSIYLNQFDYASSTIGLLWALGVVAEVLLFVFMKQLLKWISLRHILLISIILAIGRWLLIAFFVDCFSLMVIAQLLHAATFGASHVVAIHLLHKYFSQQHQGRGQALYSSLTFGLGGMIGSFCSGYFWDIYGSSLVFVMASICCVIAFMLAFIWVGRENQTVKL
ncbi:MAG: MFS transporter [Methylococcales symbiont of Hymedesmia sp. n. MRB-2018]|nr:MAG: MFS transporter [Methylococcales symbiont of Hymedesmia sp. n. MRB-2018]